MYLRVVSVCSPLCGNPKEGHLLVVEFVYSNPLLIVCRSQKVHKVPLEVVAEALDVLLRVLANDL